MGAKAFNEYGYIPRINVLGPSGFTGTPSARSKRAFGGTVMCDGEEIVPACRVAGTLLFSHGGDLSGSPFGFGDGNNGFNAEHPMLPKSEEWRREQRPAWQLPLQKCAATKR